MTATTTPGTEIEVYEARPSTSPTLFGTADPAEVVAAATAAAKPLADVIERQQLYAPIRGGKYVRVEGWTLLGSMVGVFPVCVWSRRTDTGWEARVEARTRHGEIVGAAEASCDRSEPRWQDADDYALRSMAQTRATSKALRQPLGFIVTLAGFEATPLEEMPVSPDPPSSGRTVDPDGNVFPDERGPSPFQFQPPAARAPSDRRSDAQYKNMYRLAKLLEQRDPSYSLDKLRAEARAMYGSDLAELTKRQASELITLLKQRAGEN